MNADGGLISVHPWFVEAVFPEKNPGKLLVRYLLKAVRKSEFFCPVHKSPTVKSRRNHSTADGSIPTVKSRRNHSTADGSITDFSKLRKLTNDELLQVVIHPANANSLMSSYPFTILTKIANFT